jgi:hypothetical protein
MIGWLPINMIEFASNGRESGLPTGGPNHPFGGGPSRIGDLYFTEIIGVRHGKIKVSDKAFSGEKHESCSYSLAVWPRCNC